MYLVLLLVFVPAASDAARKQRHFFLLSSSTSSVCHPDLLRLSSSNRGSSRGSSVVVFQSPFPSFVPAASDAARKQRQLFPLSSSTFSLCRSHSCRGSSVVSRIQCRCIWSFSLSSYPPHLMRPASSAIFSSVILDLLLFLSSSTLVPDACPRPDRGSGEGKSSKGSRVFSSAERAGPPCGGGSARSRLRGARACLALLAALAVLALAVPRPRRRRDLYLSYPPHLMRPGSSARLFPLWHPRLFPLCHPERSACPEYALSFAKGLSKERISQLSHDLYQQLVLAVGLVSSAVAAVLSLSLRRMAGGA